jgi:hypothetical protein
MLKSLQAGRDVKDMGNPRGHADANRVDYTAEGMG